MTAGARKVLERPVALLIARQNAVILFADGCVPIYTRPVCGE